MRWGCPQASPPHWANRSPYKKNKWAKQRTELITAASAVSNNNGYFYCVLYLQQGYFRMHCIVLLSISNHIFSCFIIIFLSLTITIFILCFNLFDFICLLYSGVTVVAVYLSIRHLFIFSRCCQYECFLDIFKHNFTEYSSIFITFYTFIKDM